MRSADHFKVVDLPSLIWPSNVTIPSKRFRLFVAADTENNTVDVVSAFANAALEKFRAGELAGTAVLMI